MGKTIIQTIGPLYGEVVNGTVFGRPNGSIYVPISNRITLTVEGTHVSRQSESVPSWVIKNSSGTWKQAKIVAESQDVANYIRLQISADESFATLEASRGFSAGLFNVTTNYLIPVYTEGVPATPTEGTTYYIRAVLFSASGEPVAISEVSTLIGVEI